MLWILYYTNTYYSAVHSAHRRFARFLYGCLLFNSLFPTRRRGQGAQHLAGPLAGGPAKVGALVGAPSDAGLDAVASCGVMCRAGGRGTVGSSEVGDLLISLRLPPPLHLAGGDDGGAKLRRGHGLHELLDRARRVLRWQCMRDDAQD